jgi:uncharacterized membrane protein YbaN (DUF454 family)
MKTYIYQRLWLRKMVGIFLIAFGVLGMILPIIPGAIFAIIGLEFIGIRLAFFDRLFPGRIGSAESLT